MESTRDPLALLVVEALERDPVSAARLSELIHDGQADPVLLTTERAAARLSVHPKTLSRAAREGRVPGAERAGRSWRFDPSLLAIVPVTRTTPRSSARRRPRHADSSAQPTSVLAMRQLARDAKPSTPSSERDTVEPPQLVAPAPAATGRGRDPREKRP
jgi:excisionase family DNA binding protein